MRPAGVLLPAIGVLAVQQVFFSVPAGIWVRGATIGLLTALVAVGMALIYRANRVLNFAQADLGYVPALLGVMLVTITGVHYLLGLLAGLAGSIVLGGLVEAGIVRRFFRAPRLILTVATIGLAQLLAAGALILAGRWDAPSAGTRIDLPWDVTFRIAPLIFEGDYVLAWVVGPLALVGVGLFLRGTAAGTAIRASADRADRAMLLGVPVKRLHMVVWALAGGLAFVALWLRAGILGLPVGQALGFTLLLRSVAALLIGRMTHLGAIAAGAVALGVLETAVDFRAASTAQSQAVLAGVILAVLLIRRQAARRADRDETSSWRAAEEVRPVPTALRRVGEVRLVRGIGITLLAIGAIVGPHLLSTDRSLKASAVLVFGIIGVSVVVLTGWAGQVSLGQMAFVAVGAAVTAAATAAWNVDLVVALGLSMLAGAAVAVVVGLPALRFRGLYLAVTTLAFALATSAYFLNDDFFGWVNDGRVARLPLLGRIDLESPTRIYYVALAGLALSMIALSGIRRSRTGRVLLALRENEPAVQTYGVDPVRAKLTAFALSGATAAFAGGIFAYHQHGFHPVSYAVADGLAVFTMSVIGGLGSLWGGVLGALFLKGGEWFLPGEWVFLTTGVGVLFVLLVLPGGLGGLVFGLRDRWLRSVARRRDVVVPSLASEPTELSIHAAGERVGTSGGPR